MGRDTLVEPCLQHQRDEGEEREVLRVGHRLA